MEKGTRELPCLRGIEPRPQSVWSGDRGRFLFVVLGQLRGIYIPPQESANVSGSEQRSDRKALAEFQHFCYIRTPLRAHREFRAGEMLGSGLSVQETGNMLVWLR